MDGRHTLLMDIDRALIAGLKMISDSPSAGIFLRRALSKHLSSRETSFLGTSCSSSPGRVDWLWQASTCAVFRDPRKRNLKSDMYLSPSFPPCRKINRYPAHCIFSLVLRVAFRNCLPAHGEQNWAAQINKDERPSLRRGEGIILKDSASKKMKDRLSLP